MERGPFRIGFLALDEFALMSFASSVEPLRAANLLAGKPLYALRYFALDGKAAISSGGAQIPAEALSGKVTGLDLLFVLAGGDPSRHISNRSLLAALRQLARAGIGIGGISGGPLVLAAAGLLDNRRFTLHWEHAEMLAARWPHLVPERVRFVIDRDRITCGGGIAPLDLMHALIRRDHGAAFAQKVSDWFLHAHVDDPADPQRAPAAERHRVQHRALVKVLEKMETAIDEPLSRAAMAEYAGISERHLDRLFASEMASTFRDEYLAIRLARARSLLRQGSMLMSEIAYAVGFSGTSQFARAYVRHFGEKPSRLRP